MCFHQSSYLHLKICPLKRLVIEVLLCIIVHWHLNSFFFICALSAISVQISHQININKCNASMISEVVIKRSAPHFILQNVLQRVVVFMIILRLIFQDRDLGTGWKANTRYQRHLQEKKTKTFTQDSNSQKTAISLSWDSWIKTHLKKATEETSRSTESDLPIYWKHKYCSTV